MFNYLLKNIIPDLLLPSPLQTFDVMDLVGSVRTCGIKRDDLIHPALSGNKLRKLAGYIEPHLKEDDITLVTFGGPHSNHLHASGWLCNQLGWNMLAIMPQYISHNHNATLDDLVSNKVEIFRADSGQMKKWNSSDLEDICDHFALTRDKTVLVPMGGDGPPAQKGLSQMVDEVEVDLPGLKEWIIPVGTGRTAEAIMQEAGMEHLYSLYIPFKKQRIRNSLLERFRSLSERGYNIKILPEPERRFGKLQEGLSSFVHAFEKDTSIKLDPIYNGPAMKFWLEDGMQGYFQPVLIHTGGLQGWRGIVN